jgi:transposase
MTAPPDIHWKETRSEMFKLSVSEPNPELQIRFQTFTWMINGKSIEEVSEILEIDPRDVEQWLAWYRHGGLAEVRRHRQGSRGRPTMLTAEQLKILKTKLSGGTLRTAQEVKDWVYEVFGVEYTRAGIKTLLQRMARPERDTAGD